MGSRVMYHYLGITQMGINKFESFVCESGLTVRKLKKRVITTDGIREEQDKNLTYGLKLNNINQLMAGDITYLIFKDQKYYVFTLKDAYCKRIIGLHGSDKMMAINSVTTYLQAKRLRGTSIKHCIHHTDAGSQYKSTIYKKLLAKDEIKMSIADNCLENGMAEQLNSVIKNDYMIDTIKDVKHLNTILNKIKHLINHDRHVAALGYRTSVQFEKWLETISVENRPVIEMYDFTKAELETFSKE
jgi:transposase InsO family protein